MKRTFFGFTAAALLATGSASAAPIVTETFTYADGDLVSNPAWSNHSGTGSFIQVSSGAAVLTHGSGSREDANTGFAAVTSGVLTATFDIVVTDDAGWGSSTDFEYFAHFFDAGDSNFRGRLSITAPTATGDYSVGLSSGSSTEDVTTTTAFSFGDTVSVSLEFNLDTGIAKAVVGTENLTGTGVFTGETINAFALRQSDSGADETITVDNLVIDYVPEPTSLALLGLGSLFVARRRRA